MLFCVLSGCRGQKACSSVWDLCCVEPPLHGTVWDLCHVEPLLHGTVSCLTEWLGSGVELSVWTIPILFTKNRNNFKIPSFVTNSNTLKFSLFKILNHRHSSDSSQFSTPTDTYFYSFSSHSGLLSRLFLYLIMLSLFPLPLLSLTVSLLPLLSENIFFPLLSRSEAFRHWSSLVLSFILSVSYILGILRIWG